MKKVLLFHMQGCPYCVEARRYIDQVCEQNPALRAVDVEMIDERLHPVIAWRHDYWYVPTFYVDGQKVHEGACTKDKVEQILKMAAE